MLSMVREGQSVDGACRCKTVDHHLQKLSSARVKGRHQGDRWLP